MTLFSVIFVYAVGEKQTQTINVVFCSMFLLTNPGSVLQIQRIIIVCTYVCADVHYTNENELMNFYKNNHSNTALTPHKHNIDCKHAS